MFIKAASDEVRFIYKIKSIIINLFRTNRSIKPTKAGVIFILLIFGVGFGALNTGNNFLYLLISIMLMLLVGSGILSEQAVRKLTLVRNVPSNIYANIPCKVSLRIENKKFFFPTVDVVFSEKQQTNKLIMNKEYISLIMPRESVEILADYVFLCRGVHQLKWVSFATMWPFGFVSRKAFREFSDSIVVYPQIFPINESSDFSYQNTIGTTIDNKKGDDGDVSSLRFYNIGDEPRKIHWKTSAKKNRLVVKENNNIETTLYSIELVVLDENPSKSSYEHSLSMVASYALHYLNLSCLVSVNIFDKCIPFGTGELHKNRILSVIANLPDTFNHIKTRKYQVNIRSNMISILLYENSVKVRNSL